MDASHSRLLTPSGYCQADPSTALRAGAGPAAQLPAACALRPELASVAIGRSFTRTTLRSWDLAELSAQAELVVAGGWWPGIAGTPLLGPGQLVTDSRPV